MALLPRFDTPASLRDAPAGSPFYTAWSNFIAGGLADLSPGDNGGAFYDPTQTDVNVVASKTLTWGGFPRDVLLPANRDNRPAAYALADGNVAQRARQNEYFEWYVRRNRAGKISKLTFVTEMPEYFQRLWDTDPALVVNVYRALVSPAVVQADLQSAGGAYNKFNRWNTVDGIVHYIQNINTLSAALGLAQSGRSSPPPFPDNFEARPALAGAPTSVDPRVSFDVHMLVAEGPARDLPGPGGPLHRRMERQRLHQAQRLARRQLLADRSRRPGHGAAARIRGARPARASWWATSGSADTPSNTAARSPSTSPCPRCRHRRDDGSPRRRAMRTKTLHASETPARRSRRSIAPGRRPGRRRALGGARGLLLRPATQPLKGIHRPGPDSAGRRGRAGLAARAGLRRDRAGRHPGKHRPGLQQGPPALSVLEDPQPEAGQALPARPPAPHLDDGGGAGLPARSTGRKRLRLGRHNTSLCSTWVNIGFSRRGSSCWRASRTRTLSAIAASSWGCRSGRPSSAIRPRRPTGLPPQVEGRRAEERSRHRPHPGLGPRAAVLDDLADLLKAGGACGRPSGWSSSSAGTRWPATLRGHEHFGFKDGVSQPGVRGKLSAAPGDYITPATSRRATPGASTWPNPGSSWSGRASSSWASRASPPRTRSTPRRRRRELPAVGPARARTWSSGGCSRTSRPSGLRGPGRQRGWGWRGTSSPPCWWAAGRAARRSCGSPAATIPRSADDDFANNHFIFDDDARPSALRPIPGYPGDGYPQAAADFLAQVCPHFAHIRKVHPRDSATDMGKPADSFAPDDPAARDPVRPAARRRQAPQAGAHREGPGADVPLLRRQHRGPVRVPAAPVGQLRRRSRTSAATIRSSARTDARAPGCASSTSPPRPAPCASRSRASG